MAAVLPCPYESPVPQALGLCAEEWGLGIEQRSEKNGCVLLSIEGKKMTERRVEGAAADTDSLAVP